MKNDIQEILAPKMGQDVLNVLLRHVAHLPKEGFVAGQAVASAIDELLGTGRPVYNDIDVFLGPSQWTEQTGEAPEDKQDYRRRVAQQVHYLSEEQITSDSYSQTMNLASRTLYKVRKTRTDGLVNRVLVDWDWPLRNADDAKRAAGLIQVFDLNNVQVAVNVETGELTWTRAYERFLTSRQLQVTQSFTPMHSLLRYLKKREELGVFGNDAAHVGLVQHLLRANELTAELRERRKDDFARGYRFFDLPFLSEYVKRDRTAGKLMTSYFHRLGTGARQMPLSFGAKYKELYERFADKLSPHFTLTASEKGKLWLVTSNPEDVDKPCVAPFPGADDAFGYRTSSQLVVRRYWQLAYAPGKKLSRRRTLFESFLAQLREEQVRKAYEQGLFLVGDDYLEGCDSAMALEELARVVNEHDEFAWSVMPLAIGQQIELMRRLRKAFKAHGVPAAWGIFHERGVKDLKQWLEDDSALQAEVKVLLGTREPLYSRRLPLPAFEDGIEVQELDNAYDLRVEGGKMRHCVAGYAGSVSTESCRILSLRKGPSVDDCATVEWNFPESRTLPDFEKVGEQGIRPLQVTCGQIRSFGNSQADDDLIALESKLRAQVNAWLEANPLAGWEMLKPQQLAARRDPATATSDLKRAKFFGGRRLQAHQAAEDFPF